MSNPANQFLWSYSYTSSGQMGPNLPSGRTADPAYKRLSVGARNRGGQRVPSDQRKPGLGGETHRNDPDGHWLDMAYQRELGRNIDDMLRMVDVLTHHQEHGEVCPAGWQKGKDAMQDNPESVAKYLSENAKDL